MTPTAKVWIGVGTLSALYWLFASKASASTQSSGAWTPRNASEAEIQAKLRAEAERQEVPVPFVFANADLESGFKNVKAAKGESYGPLQVHTSAGYTAQQLQDMDLSIRVGVQLLKKRLALAKGDTELARVMNFCGPGYTKSCSATSIAHVKARWAPAAKKWGVPARYAV